MKPAYEARDRLGARNAEDRHRCWTASGNYRTALAYYDYLLENFTTTDLSATEIHEIGLREVARLHDDMRGVMKQVEFKGDLPAFFEFMRTDAQFYYPGYGGRARGLARCGERAHRRHARRNWPGFS